MARDIPRARSGNGKVSHSQVAALRALGSAPSEQEIRDRAYEIFRLRVNGGVPGDDLSDWLMAERELQATAHQPRSLEM